jgi:hypothetical protein
MMPQLSYRFFPANKQQEVSTDLRTVSKAAPALHSIDNKIQQAVSCQLGRQRAQHCGWEAGLDFLLNIYVHKQQAPKQRLEVWLLQMLGCREPERAQRSTAQHVDSEYRGAR